MVEEDHRPVPGRRLGKTERRGDVADQRPGSGSEDRERRSELRSGSSLRTDAKPAGTQRHCGEVDQVRRGRVRLYRSDWELVRIDYAARIGNVACQAVLAT